jgi:hypothetical protein
MASPLTPQMPPEPRPAAARRPYQKPQVRSCELFERRALACGIQPSARGQPGCGTFHQSV